MSATSKPPIGIFGAGARTALGRSLPATAAAVRSHIAHIGRHPFLIDPLGRSMKCARAEWLPARFDGEERFIALAKNAAKEALAPILRDRDRKSRLDVFVGLPEARPGRPSDLDASVSEALGKKASWGSHVGEVTSIAAGHAAGIVAIEQASERIWRGEADVCLAGGVDSYLEVETMDWLEESGRLHTASQRLGFTPGEGAGFCLLVSARWLEENKLTAPASILAAGSAEEIARIRTDTVCVGTGLSAAIEAAISPLRKTRDRIDWMIGDLNGEPYRSDELGFALTRASDVIAGTSDILAPAEYWGDVGAASGPLFAGLAFASAARSQRRGPLALMWASSEGGRRAALLLRLEPREMEDT